MKNTIAKKSELTNNNANKVKYPRYLYGSPTYRSWNNMKDRCLNKNNKQYKDYGGRGIMFDERWLEFAYFYEDMGEKPNGTTLDRVDVDKNYCKENCRWATREEQQRNQRTHKRVDVGITYDEKHPTCKYQVGISYKNKRYASRFKTFDEAKKWRKTMEVKLWGIQD